MSDDAGSARVNCKLFVWGGSTGSSQGAAGDFITRSSCYNRRGVINCAPWRRQCRAGYPSGTTHDSDVQSTSTISSPTWRTNNATANCSWFSSVPPNECHASSSVNRSNTRSLLAIQVAIQNPVNLLMG